MPVCLWSKSLATHVLILCLKHSHSPKLVSTVMITAQSTQSTYAHRPSNPAVIQCVYYIIRVNIIGTQPDSGHGYQEPTRPT